MALLIGVDKKQCQAVNKLASFVKYTASSLFIILSL